MRRQGMNLFPRLRGMRMALLPRKATAVEVPPQICRNAEVPRTGKVKASGGCVEDRLQTSWLMRRRVGRRIRHLWHPGAIKPRSAQPETRMSDPSRRGTAAFESSRKDSHGKGGVIESAPSLPMENAGGFCRQPAGPSVRPKPINASDADVPTIGKARWVIGGTEKIQS